MVGIAARVPQPGLTLRFLWKSSRRRQWSGGSGHSGCSRSCFRFGDRYEAFAAAGTHLQGIPVVHLHGGETTRCS